MVARDGMAVLLPGPNGVGKSTAAAACVEAGLQYLADDGVAIESSERGPVGHCLYAVLKLDVGRVRSFPSLAAGAERYEDDGRDEVLIRVGETHPGAVLASARIAVIAFPRLSEDRASSIGLVERSGMLRQLVPTAMSAGAGSLRRDFALLAELAERVPAVSLQVGTDPATIPAAVERLLEQGGAGP
jgi:hypothetical protein